MQDRLVPKLPDYAAPLRSFESLDFPTLKPLINFKILEKLSELSRIGDRLKNNPELQFICITDFEVLNLKSADELKESLTADLSDEDIAEKEEVLERNLVPYLRELGLESLWLGANHALEVKSNPDRLRHCLISLRTILEYLIEDILAPNEKLKDTEMFEKEFRKHNEGKEELSKVRISHRRRRKIEFFTSQFEFGDLEEFTQNEIKYICDCYSILCNVHQPDIGITENQVRSLKVKTGIMIWLLAYLNEVTAK